MGLIPISIFFEHHCKVPSVRDGVKSRAPIFFMLWKCFPKYTMSLPLQMNQYCWREAASDVGCPKCSNMDWGCLEKGCPWCGLPFKIMWVAPLMWVAPMWVAPISAQLSSCRSLQEATPHVKPGMNRTRTMMIVMCDASMRCSGCNYRSPERWSC